MEFKLKSARFVFVLSALSAGLLTSACDMRSRDHFSTNKVQLQEDKLVQQIAVEDLDAGMVAGLANHYNRYGDGPLSLTLTYDPKSKTMTAMKAGDALGEIVTGLRENGVRDIQTNLLPVNSTESAQVIVSYMTYNALAPKDCEVMPGIQGREINAEEDYKLGCTVDTLFARQIARPKDLKGQDTDSLSDGRRAANKVEAYRTGVNNEPLGGESASGN